LTGREPTDEEIKAFLADNSPDGHEKLIDRLLASPEYGERFAKQWLELARQNDSKGGEPDRASGASKKSPGRWALNPIDDFIRRKLDAKEPADDTAKSEAGAAYRDYVIRAFNGDLPFDQVVREQLAGDLLPTLPTAPSLPPGSRAYTGRIPKLISSIGFQLYLGDAWTDPARVVLVPLPRVDVALRVTPPAYTAGGDESLESPEGQRQIAVIENSRVDVSLKSSKPLVQARLVIKNQPFTLSRDAARATAEHDVWTLSGDSPLARVVEPMHYVIHVQDEDGLTLEKPIEGYIRLRPDNPPKAFADVRTKHVLPAAVANVFYGASDDYGLSDLKLKVRVLRAGQNESPAKAFKLPLPETAGATQTPPRRVSSMLFQLDRSFQPVLAQTAQVPPPELRDEFASHHVTLSEQTTIPFARPGGGRWVLADRKQGLDFEIRHENPKFNVYRIYPVRLEEFDLELGDQVRIELEATDFRGETPGRSSQSEAILLTVTDESGFLAATTETDQRSAEQLDAIIRIGLGETP
jgi:hypothetical protein